MSNTVTTPPAANDPSIVNADLSNLAPLFRQAVEEALAKCNDPGRAGGPLNAKVYEGMRSNARQAWLYAQGRTRPGDIVTNASTSLTSWHGYGLAVDIVHAVRFWTPFGKDSRKNEKWFADVAAIFKATRCNWGGDWTHPDTPHMQWGKCRPSPSDAARSLLGSGGVHAVWEAVGALDSPLAAPIAANTNVPVIPAAGYRSLVANGFFSKNPSDLSVKRSIRTNNPGALNITGWQQAYPGFSSITQADSAGNRTTIYWTPEHGVGAWFHLLVAGYGYGQAGSFTVTQLACRYAGNTDVNSAAVRTYITGWCRASGGNLTPLSVTRLDNDSEVLRLARAMFYHEAGGTSPLNDDQILFGVHGERTATLPPH